MNFGHVRHLHFVGIGGAGMCGIAELLHDEGLEVSGCDLLPSETTARLERLGIPVAIGHDAGHLERAQVVVMSSAVAADNAEIEAARGRGLTVIRRAEMLGEISRLKWSIAIAGTHGKTTTTSLTGFALTQAGLDPTVVVGGRVHFLGAHARLGRSEYLVCEADEYDRSFLALSPVLVVLTTVEAEHLDTYGTVDAMEEAFIAFAAAVPFYGAVIACLDDPRASPVAAPVEAGRHLRPVTAGRAARTGDPGRPRRQPLPGRPRRCRTRRTRRAAARAPQPGQRARRPRGGHRGRRPVRRRDPRHRPVHRGGAPFRAQGRTRRRAPGGRLRAPPERAGGHAAGGPVVFPKPTGMSSLTCTRGPGRSRASSARRCSTPTSSCCCRSTPRARSR
jgi:hypothetical protein